MEGGSSLPPRRQELRFFELLRFFEPLLRFVDLLLFFEPPLLELLLLEAFDDPPELRVPELFAAAADIRPAPTSTAAIPL